MAGPWIHIDGLWLVVGSAPIRVSTIITFLAVFAFVIWRFRGSKKSALYNGLVASLFTLFLYEVVFNVTGGFPPTDMLPIWGVGILILSLILGILQARKHFVPSRLPIIILALFMADWIAWVAAGFPFNMPSTQPLNLTAEAFNVSTKLLLPFAYAAGLHLTRRKSG